MVWCGGVYVCVCVHVLALEPKAVAHLVLPLLFILQSPDAMLCSFLADLENRDRCLPASFPVRVTSVYAADASGRYRAHKKAKAWQGRLETPLASPEAWTRCLLSEQDLLGKKLCL